MTVPRLHVVTSDDVVGREDFVAVAGRLMRELGSRMALHIRGVDSASRRLHDTALELAGAAGEAGTPLWVNDRIDIALAVGATGVQLGRRSLPVQAARRLLGDGCTVGYSAHGVDEAESAVANGAEVILLGTIWPTPSHPDESGSGLGPVREAGRRLSVPVVAIGGVTPERAGEAVEAGAWGVAVIRGVWSSEDPVGAAQEYLQAMEGR